MTPLETYYICAYIYIYIYGVPTKRVNQEMVQTEIFNQNKKLLQSLNITKYLSYIKKNPQIEIYVRDNCFYSYFEKHQCRSFSTKNEMK